MDTLYSNGRIAVHHIGKTSIKRTALIIAAFAISSTPSLAGSLADQIKAPWSFLIFVSSGMPKQQIVSLARQAVQSKATLVLSGFPRWEPTPVGVRKWVAQVNDDCCSGQGPSWVIDPKLFASYKVQQVPTFVLTKGGDPSDDSFSKVSGDMDIGNALKFFNQESRLDPIRKEAERRYNYSFRGDALN